MNSKRAALAQVDLVRIHGEDLFFGESHFEDHGDAGLGDFSPPGRNWRKKQVSRQLLCDRAAALQSMPLMKVRDECTDNPDRSEPVMIEEALVFTRRDRIDEHFRDVLEFDDAP